jgi:hypothetical protein
MKVLGGSRWEIVQSNKKNEGENQEETCHGRTMMRIIECMFHTPYLSRDLRVGVNDERVQ